MPQKPVTKNSPLRAQLERARSGDKVALAKALSELERLGGKALKIAPELLTANKPALRIGITGPPGAGKSTLVSALIHNLRQRDLRVGVVAVDPSSPITQGALLGDRIRYSEHFLDERVFIRSLGTRGSLGGLSASAYLMLRAFDLCDFDVVLVETVGVGQSEMDIMYVADEVIVVLVPESGDAVQAMKAGLLEIADLFVVNKADRPGADSLVRELELSAQLASDGGQKVAEVIKTVATEGQGLGPIADRVFTALDHRANWEGQRLLPQRLKHEAKALLRQGWEEWIHGQIKGIKTPKDLIKAVSI